MYGMVTTKCSDVRVCLRTNIASLVAGSFDRSGIQPTKLTKHWMISTIENISQSLHRTRRINAFPVLTFRHTEFTHHSRRNLIRVGALVPQLSESEWKGEGVTLLDKGGKAPKFRNQCRICWLLKRRRIGDNSYLNSRRSLPMQIG